MFKFGIIKYTFVLIRLRVNQIDVSLKFFLSSVETILKIHVKSDGFILDYKNLFLIWYIKSENRTVASTVTCGTPLSIDFL